MKVKLFIIVLFLFIQNVNSQVINTPLEASGFTKLSQNNEINSFVRELQNYFKYFEVETLAKLKSGREIRVIKLSLSGFGKDKNKLRVLIFAQQHGNEPSGKEGVLLLLKDFATGKLNHLLKNLDIAIIPQLNPDGGDEDKRLNDEKIDLNRDHLVLNSEENRALHNFFDKYNFHSTLDIHEYYPYSKSWQNFGFIKDIDQQIGILTNPNISDKILSFSRNEALPFMIKYIEEKGFSSAEYIVGGPPNEERIRHSTVDINDGRQSFGIMNTLSFIFEGKNGLNSLDNIKHRAEGQKTAILSYLEFLSKNSNKIKKLIENERKALLTNQKKKIILQMEHYSCGDTLSIKVKKVSDNKDTTIYTTNFHNCIKSIFEIEKPKAYLIKKEDKNLLLWLDKHNIKYDNFKRNKRMKITRATMEGLDTLTLEELEVKNPKNYKEIVINEINEDGYYIVSLNQLKGNLLSIALELKSMNGLAQYKDFEYLLNNNEYPILKIY